MSPKWVDKGGRIDAGCGRIYSIAYPFDRQRFLDASGGRFSITGRGTVATGRIERGVVNTGDPVQILGMGAEWFVFHHHWCGDVPQNP